MARSQDDRRARHTNVPPTRPSVRAREGMTLTRRCFVPVFSLTSKFPTPCGDRVVKAGRCKEHFADWKHAKESRRGMSSEAIAHLIPVRRHGSGKSASAIENKRTRERRLMRRAVA